MAWRNVKTGKAVFSEKRIVSDYQQGHNDWRIGIAFNPMWPQSRRQGWKKARDAELKFFFQTGSDGACERLLKQGIDPALFSNAA